ncbi:hypothetical protein HQ447_06485 [bacterium]|nr:hypothetical protein [bacterium]
MKLFSILLVAVSGFAVSCERHDFEGPDGTKQLNQAHGAAAHGEHAAPAGHGAPAAHGEPAEKPAH